MKIQFSHEGVLDTYYPDELCWESTPSVRVEAGATLNTFGTLWGLPPVGNYCAPTTRGVPPTQVGIIVTFVDDLGVSGTVEATTFVE